MGIVTTSSETAFNQPAETVYDFVSNPENWTTTYPGSAHVGSRALPLPLKVGDVWTESGSNPDIVYTWHLAIAMRPKLWVFNSVGLLGHDREGKGGTPGRMTIEYHFTRPGKDITLFKRTMTIEAYKDTPLPDDLFRIVNPANIDKYQAAIARQLEG